MTPRRKDFILPAIILFTFLAVMQKTYGHEAPSGWTYDPYCCNGSDCAEIPTETVRPVDGGYLVTLTPAQHPKVTKPHTLMVPAEKVKYSPDGLYHICLYPTENDVRCFYAPPSGS